jgi:hypothetical protein
LIKKLENSFKLNNQKKSKKDQEKYPECKIETKEIAIKNENC